MGLTGPIVFEYSLAVRRRFLVFDVIPSVVPTNILVISRKEYYSFP